MEKWIWLGLPALALFLLSIFLLKRQGTAFLGKIGFCLAGFLGCVGALIWLYSKMALPAQILGGILACAILLGFSMAVAVAIPIAKMARNQEIAACSYVVVLGAKMEGSVPSPAMQRRIRRAYSYMCQYPDAIAVLSGGKGSGDTISEAECMFRGLTDMGIAPQRLWLEENATSTWENLRFSKAMFLEKSGQCPARIALVSSDTHLFRASLLAKALGLAVVPIPAKTEKCLQFINDYLREIAGVWHYLLLGGRYHD